MITIESEEFNVTIKNESKKVVITDFSSKYNKPQNRLPGDTLRRVLTNILYMTTITFTEVTKQQEWVRNYYNSNKLEIWESDEDWGLLTIDDEETCLSYELEFSVIEGSISDLKEILGVEND